MNKKKLINAIDLYRDIKMMLEQKYQDYKIELFYKESASYIDYINLYLCLIIS